MRICVVGGTFDLPEAPSLLMAPERLLSSGLRAEGRTVTVRGHHDNGAFTDFEIVHIHHLGKAALFAATSPGNAKLVYTTHHDPRLLDRGLYHWQRFPWIRYFATRFVIRRADATVALSETERMYLRRLFPECRDRIIAIPNGLPADIFRPSTRKAIGARPLRLLFVGQLTHEKGVDVLLEALSLIEESVFSELSLVYRPTTMEAHFRQLAIELGISHRVSFLGTLGAQELAEVYREHDVFTLPSMSEALPSVITEAMLSGLPVVATRVGGVSEQVGLSGLVVEPGDPYQLSEALIEIASQLRSGILDFKAIRNSAVERYGLSAMIQRHLALYDDLHATQSTRRKSGWSASWVNTGAHSLISVVGSRVSNRGWLAR